jgi:GNAT superfamily N-acetyltransferase
MGSWQIGPLSKDHERGEFSCGKASLDLYLRQQAGQLQKKNYGRTFVATRPGANRVIGYYTLATGGVQFEQLPADVSRKLPKHPAPVVLLARLAVDQTARGERLGEGLLLDACDRCLGLSEQVGIYAVLVHAKDEGARQFYLKYGFVPLVDQPLHLFLPITTIRDGLAD